MFSIFIALAALAISVISPFISSAMNNRHELKMYKQKFYDEHKASVIGEYVKSTKLILELTDHNALIAYSNAYGEIFFCTPESLWEDIEKLDSAIRSFHRISQFKDSSTYKESIKLFSKIIKELSAYNPRVEHRSKDEK